jgi:predicted DsbA family dithiol-disulfide isomerase
MPYQLNPNVPEEGEDLMEHLEKKYGPQVRLHNIMLLILYINRILTVSK